MGCPIVLPAVPALLRTTAGGGGQQIPGRVRQPLFPPTPIVVRARLVVGQQIVNIILVAEAACNSIGDSAGDVREFPGIKIHIGRVVVADTVEHAGIEGVEAENPVELAGSEGIELAQKCVIIGERWRSKPRGGRK